MDDAVMEKGSMARGERVHGACLVHTRVAFVTRPYPHAVNGAHGHTLLTMREAASLQQRHSLT